MFGHKGQSFRSVFIRLLLLGVMQLAGVTFACVSAAESPPPSPPASQPSLRDSVVKVFVTSNSMDFYRPWQSQGSTSTTGSGSVIEGQRILTNAHVVSDSTFIQIRKESDPRSFTARVEAIGHDCDLAILKVDDPSFFDGVVPMSLGELPSLQDAVTVIGFPKGGDKLSITKGVVSRIEVVPYTQSNKSLLGGQIDAAINPGNSGGPVLQDGKLVGVAMQVMGNSQNIGYMIPAPIIAHFLEDLADDRYDGFPSLGVEFHSTENKTLREFYGIDEMTGGVLVTRVLPYSAADGYLREDDVLVEIDGIPIAEDGTFEFRATERMALNHLINRRQVNEKMDIKFVRKRNLHHKSVPMKDYIGLVPMPHYFKRPPYYIYGGLVFTPLSADLLKSWGPNWWEKAPLDFLHYLVGQGRLNFDDKQEIVVLLTVLPDDINVGYHDYNNEVIARVNGREFKSFREFIEILEENRKRYAVFETDQNLKIVLGTENISEVTENILKRNNIPRQYSEDIIEWFEKKRR